MQDQYMGSPCRYQWNGMQGYTNYVDRLQCPPVVVGGMLGMVWYDDSLSVLIFVWSSSTRARLSVCRRHTGTVERNLEPP